MSEQENVYRIAGEALDLSQRLEEALTITIMMMYMLKYECKDLDTKIIKKAKANQKLKSKPVTTMRQKKLIEKGDILLLVENGSMGQLKKTLELFFQVTPLGPSPIFDVLGEALEARNYLCHKFFKEYNTIKSKGQFDAVAKLEEMQTNLREAIAFAMGLTDKLNRQFPQTFSDLLQQRLH